MRAKSLALLVLALGCGLVAAIGITQVMAKKSDGPVVPAGETVDIYVALEEIPFGEAITPLNVKLEAWPKSKVPEDAITKIDDLKDRRTKVALFPGEPILEKKLFKPGDTEQGAVALIPRGYRVVPVKVDAVTGGANLIRPGNRVDVLVNLRQNPEVGIKATCTKMLLQDVKVFAVNDVVRLERKKEAEETIHAATISLLLTPEQASKVSLATQLGTIQLSLRPPDEVGTPHVDEINVQALFGPSDGGRREDESLVPETAGSGKDNLLEFLDRMEAKATPAADTPAPIAAAPQAASSVTPAPTGETWQMRVITGEAVDMKQLERNTADPGATGSRMWRVSSVGEEMLMTDPAEGTPLDAAPASPPDAATDESTNITDLFGGDEEDSKEK